MKQATRLVSMDADNVSKTDVATLIADDFEAPKVSRTEKKRIGF
jgi:hypothetical protein